MISETIFLISCLRLLAGGGVFWNKYLKKSDILSGHPELSSLSPAYTAYTGGGRQEPLCL